MIEIKDLKFKYANSEKPILNNINLTVNAGDYLSIIGENGSGKTTLVRIILGLLKNTGGSIRVGTKKIGYLPQRKDNLASFPITVFELLNSYRKILRVKDTACVSAYLEQVNLSEFKNALVGDLSGGQLQKLYIARALIGSPELLVLDELSTGIDVIGQKEIYSFVKELNSKKGLTVISVDHNLDAAIFNSTKIFHIKNGEGHLCNPQQYSSEFFNPAFARFSVKGKE